MALVDLSDDEIGKHPAYTDPAQIEMSTLFNRDKPIENIIQYIDGITWVIDYFLQWKDVNDIAQQPDINIPATQLKYIKINKLEVKVQTAITQTIPEDIGGEFIVSSGYTPVYGDPFTARLTGGRIGLFVVTEVNTKTYGLHEAYTVVFKLLSFLDTDTTIYDDILHKVMREYVYDKQHMTKYGAPILLQDTYDKKCDVQVSIARLSSYYIQKFMNRDTRMLTLPTKTGLYIDPLLTDFVFKIFDNQQELSQLTRVDVPKVHVSYSIWDMLLAKDTALPVSKNLAYLPIPNGFIGAQLRSAVILGVTHTIRELNELDTIAIPDMIDEVVTIPEIDTATIESEPVEDVVEDTPIEGSEPIEELPLVSTSDTYSYVLSTNFYELDYMSSGEIERLTLQYLNKEIDSALLSKLLSEYSNWSLLNQYYFLPILLLVSKEYLLYNYDPI